MDDRRPESKIKVTPLPCFEVTWDGDGKRSVKNPDAAGEMAALTGVAAMAVLEMLERELRVFDRYAPWIRLSAEYGYLTTTFPRKEVRICPLCALGNVERKALPVARPEHQLPLSTVCLKHNTSLFAIGSERRGSEWEPDVLTPPFPGEIWTTIERLTGGRGRDLDRRKGTITPNAVRMNGLFGDDRRAASTARDLGFAGVAEAREAFFGMLFLLTRKRPEGNGVVADLFHPSHRQHRIFFYPGATSLDNFGIGDDDPNTALDIIGALLCRNPNLFPYRLSGISGVSRTRFINRYRKDLGELSTEPLLLLASLFDQHVGQFFETSISKYFPLFASSWHEAVRRYYEAK
ncbi:MAG: hypothetical protein ABJQ26_01330 [Maricaulis sp.]|uniref:TniQ family protein n=1 Tax=Maricaulis sp. TaxID=1486257 RepID=UPI00329A3B7E